MTKHFTPPTIALVLVLFLSLPASTWGDVCYPCPPPRHELCDPARGPNSYGNCLAHNDREDERYNECLQQRAECERQQREEQLERYCRENPDATQCQ